MPNSSSLDTLARYLLLPLFSALGFYCTWTLSRRTGLFPQVEQIFTPNGGPLNLPDTSIPLKTTYTTIPQIDEFVTFLAAIFYPTMDGRDPAASLQAAHFAGQMMAVYVVVEIEGRRRGNAWKLAGFTTVLGLLCQSVAFTVAGPLYYALHLSTSPTTLSPSTSAHSRTSPPPSSSLLILPPHNLVLIPISLTLSFLIPSVIIALPSPSILTFDQKQTWMAIWQIFPITSTLIFYALSLPLSLVFPSSSQASYTSSSDRSRHVLGYLRPCYIFALSISLLSHIPTLTLTLSSVFFPTLFNPDALASLHPKAVFLPPAPNSRVQVKDIAEGFHHFLIYDEAIGLSAMILWSVVLLRNADRERRWGVSGWVAYLAELAATVVLAGPAAAVINTVWSRDELVLGGEEAPVGFQEQEASKEKSKGLEGVQM